MIHYEENIFGYTHLAQFNYAPDDIVFRYTYRKSGYSLFSEALVAVWHIKKKQPC